MTASRLLPGTAKLRANGLLDMLYTPSELADELCIEQRSIYTKLIPAGLPHRKDEKGFIWLHGPEVARWVRELSQRRSKLEDNEAYCVRCRGAVPLHNPKRIRRGRFRLLQAKCPQCGAIVNKGVKKGR